MERVFWHFDWNVIREIGDRWAMDAQKKREKSGTNLYKGISRKREKRRFLVLFG
jgi:hypothetical protein